MKLKDLTPDSENTITIDKTNINLEEVRTLINIVSGDMDDKEEILFSLAALGLSQQERQDIIRSLFP